MKPRAALLLILAVLVAVPATAAVRLGAMEHHVRSSTYEDTYYVPAAGWLPVLSLGWDEALADLLWMRALVYFGDEVAAQGRVQHVFDYADAMLALDPDFRAVYHWVATAGLYRPVAITPEDVENSLTIMRRGLARFPDDGELAWAIGATLAFELPPLLDDQDARERARSEGADYLAMAARRGAGPAWAAISNATILRRVGRTEAAIRHLEEMYAMVGDQAMRGQITAALSELRSQAYGEAFTEANRVEEEGRVRELPYVSAELYFILGPRPVVDWRRPYTAGFGAQLFEEERSTADAPEE